MLIFCVMKEMRSVSATEILVELSSYSLRIPISYIMLLTNSGVFVYTHRELEREQWNSIFTKYGFEGN